MALENAKRDDNFVTTLQGVDMTTGKLPTRIYVDEATHRMLVSTVVTGGVAGALVTEAHDEIALTYVTVGNGIGKIATAVYKLDGTIVATLTLSYDANDKLSGVVRS